MGRIKAWILGLSILVISLVALVVFAPSLFIPFVLRLYVTDLDLQLDNVQGVVVRTSYSDVSQASLISDGLRLELSGLHIDYRLAALMAGEIDSLTADSIRLSILPTNSSAARQMPSAEELVQILETLPVKRAVISGFELAIDNSSFAGQLTFNNSPIELEAEFTSSRLENALFELDLEQIDDDLLSAHIAATNDGQPTMDAELLARVSSSGIDVSGSAQLQISEFIKLLPLGQDYSELEFSQEDVQVEARFSIASPLDELALSDLSVQLNNQDSEIVIKQLLPRLALETSLALPIEVVGEISVSNSRLSLTNEEMRLAGKFNSAGSTADTESLISNTSLVCRTWANCNLDADWQTELLSWSLAGVSGEFAFGEGHLKLNYANDELRLSSPTANISLPSIRSGQASAALDLVLSDISYRRGFAIDGALDFESTYLDSNIEGIQLINPFLSGHAELDEGALTAVVEFSLNNHLKIGSAIEHYFYRDTGQAEIQLAATDFSAASPLSGSLQIDALNSDLVAGTVQAQANISWSQQTDKSWEFGGPARLDLENISGFLNDSYFVNVDSGVYAEIITPLGLRSIESHPLNISSIDVGMPLKNISANYSFDTSRALFQIRDLDTAVFGGSISIPQFDYNWHREENELGLVLSNLNLKPIVELAKYPSLQVDGLVSGYLPLILRGDKVIIEDGLISALNPGGSIRYTPANPIPSSNSSVQLVNDALSNYQFEILDTNVRYPENGDLELSVRLEGTNPDMNNGQAINLNLNVINNVPSLLRSLQATRVITDALEESIRIQQ